MAEQLLNVTKAAGVAGVISSLLSMIIIPLYYLSMGQIYEKAGYASWKSIIPFYKYYILFKFTWGNGYYCFLMVIPIANIVIWIMTKYKLNNVFECSTIMFILNIFLPFIAAPVYGYSNEIEYVGDNKGDDIYYKPEY